jgi:hypothetical protein
MPRNDNHKYIEGKIVTEWSYRLQDALKLCRAGKMMEFTPRYGMTFQGKFPQKNNKNLGVLVTWRNHFIWNDEHGISTPFIVTIVDMPDRKMGDKGRGEKAIVLWKERRVFNGDE